MPMRRRSRSRSTIGRRAEHRVPRQAGERPAQAARRRVAESRHRRSVQVACVRAGQREGQFKPVVLQCARTCDFRSTTTRPPESHGRHASSQHHGETAPDPVHRRVPPRVRGAIRDLNALGGGGVGDGRRGVRRVCPEGVNHRRVARHRAGVREPARARTSRPHRRPRVAPGVDGLQRAGYRCQSCGVVRDRARHPRRAGEGSGTRRWSVCCRFPSSRESFTTRPCSGRAAGGLSSDGRSVSPFWLLRLQAEALRRSRS